MEAGGRGGRYELRSRCGQTSGKGNSSSSVAEVLEKKNSSSAQEDSIPEDSQPTPKEAIPVTEELSSTTKQKVEEGKWFKQNTDCAYMGLKAWNKQQKRRQGSQYELVRPLSTNGWLEWKKGFLFHTNFEAKPIGASMDDSELFFVENFSRTKCLNKKARRVQKVTLCVPVQRLDPECSDDEIYQGCNCCRSCRVRLPHPADGGFTVGSIYAAHSVRKLKVLPKPKV